MSRSVPKQLRKRVLRELQQNPAWRLDAGPAWLCPYCGEAAGRDERPDETAEDAAAARALEHLERCPAWREFEGRPLPLGELQARAGAAKAREGIRRSLMSAPSWQLYDVARRWYCPFCAKATEAAVPEGGRVSSAVLREIERHLGACEDHARGRGDEKPLPFLKSMVAFANRTRKMAEQIRRKIETDAAWRLRDAEGRWVCPYCRKVQERIAFSPPQEMVHAAPLEIAKHLSAGCERFRAAAGGAGAEAQSSVSLEIVRLGAAATTDIVRMSGQPPAAVSGEFKATSSTPGSARLDRAARRDAIEASLSEVRQLAGPGGADAAPALPDIDGFEVRSFYRGAHAHALDFADVIPLDGRRAAIVLGGVAGESVSPTSGAGADTSALVLPVVRNLLRIHAKKGRAPAEVLQLVNQDLFADLEGRTFVSVLYGLLDAGRLTYRFARAGTNAPVIFNPKRRPDLHPIESTGMVLGIDRGPVFEGSIEEREVALEPDDLLVQFTHGAATAENVDGAPIGLERVHDLVRRYGRHEADYFVAKFGSFFEDWSRGAPLAQDACLIALKIKP